MVWYRFRVGGRSVRIRHNTSTHRYKVFIDYVEVMDVTKSVGESIVEVLSCYLTNMRCLGRGSTREKSNILLRSFIMNRAYLAAILLVVFAAVAVSNAYQIILKPVNSQCMFIWAVNYSDSYVRVGYDFIEVSGIRFYANSSVQANITILEWNEEYKSIDGATVIRFLAYTPVPAEINVTLAGLDNNRYYTIYVNNTPYEAVLSDDDGTISFTAKTASEKLYTVVVGYCIPPTATETGVIAAPTEAPPVPPPLQPVVEIIEEVVKACNLWILLVVLLAAFAVYLYMFRR